MGAKKFSELGYIFQHPLKSKVHTFKDYTRLDNFTLNLVGLFNGKFDKDHLARIELTNTHAPTERTRGFRLHQILLERGTKLNRRLTCVF